MVPVSSDTPGIMKNTDLDHKIHCVAFVVDASTADVMPDKVYKQMKDLQIKMNQRGMLERLKRLLRRNQIQCVLTMVE